LTVNDIFHAQNRINNLVDTITIGIEELDAIDSRLSQYESSLNTIKDLVASIQQRDTVETSKSTNMDCLRETLEKILVRVIISLIYLF
ncbi:MAG: hypothetical protein MHPSP_003493, partial [Paramarteilia canceri]